ncbi:hypothetical protein ND926_13965 [Vibrio diabolicus]|uniref:hypothetical protein n=1 Tax=Vibrio diabolicus TaxID=50719 RepID=UPI000CE93C38|nr:hypothetical protein [Vibrio diabolicus]AVF95408.1 hypothetical protein AL552_17470 [Vibrio diabolicus]EHK5111892.1 hypothetical protein [Vibrio parahaemolyticus]MCS0338569.1 hypothetical protein [Vibrio diabolicus]MCS0356432.1 hypothetical protein [Vibrio diabolicus]
MENLVVYSTDGVEYQIFEVSESEIKKALGHRALLVKALDIEIIYDQIIEAYWDYKNKVNYWNLRSLSSPFADYVFNHEVRSSLNRLAFNLFNLSKLYLDWHYNERKKRCFSFELTNEDSAKQQVIDHRSEIYDTNLNYVVGCNLRGHSQHSALPVRTFTTGVRYDHDTSNRTAHFNIYYYYEDLEKAGVPKGMLSKDIKLDLTEIIDGFVYAISQKHMLNRKLTEVVVGKARDSLTSMWQNYATKAGFENYRCEVHTQKNRRVGLSLEWFDVFEHLKEKHGNSINYSNITFEK